MNEILNTRPKVQICQRCGDVELSSDGTCPVCVQQVVYTIPDILPFPLSVIRTRKCPNWQMSRNKYYQGRHRVGSKEPKFPRMRTCAVIAQDGKNYMTACGDIVSAGLSVWEGVTCPACRRALRKVLNDRDH